MLDKMVKKLSRMSSKGTALLQCYATALLIGLQ